jgi:hypothetical protein
MASPIRPFIELRTGNEDVYRQLMLDNGCVLAIPEDFSYEEVLVGIISRERENAREGVRQDLIDLLQAMNLSDIPEQRSNANT